MHEVRTTFGDLHDGETIIDKNGHDWKISGFGISLTRSDGTYAFGTLTGGGGVTRFRQPVSQPVTVLRDDPVQVVEQKLDATVIAENTPAEIAEADQAQLTGMPVHVPDFGKLTPLEKRSHLYLLHGVYAEDVQTEKQISDWHRDLHAGKVKSEVRPHEHA
jgi:hypothetical protein